MTPYHFERQGRSARSVAVLAGVYAALAVLAIRFDAAWWVVGLMALATLPALLDIARASRAGMSLDHTTLRWFSGPRQAEARLADIRHIRMDTRWDFSVRVSVVLPSGRRIRLPDESTPHHRTLEPLLQQAGLRVERHHFTAF